MTFNPLLRTLAIAAMGACSLTACVVAPASRPYPAYSYPSNPAYPGVPGGTVIVSPAPPPPPQVEVIPAVPFAGAVWISGYWNWSNGRHVWMPGHYSRPVPGYRFEPHRWEQRHDGWYLGGGRWTR